MKTTEGLSADAYLDLRPIPTLLVALAAGMVEAPLLTGILVKVASKVTSERRPLPSRCFQSLLHGSCLEAFGSEEPVLFSVSHFRIRKSILECFPLLALCPYCTKSNKGRCGFFFFLTAFSLNSH